LLNRTRLLAGVGGRAIAEFTELSRARHERVTNTRQLCGVKTRISLWAAASLLLSGIVAQGQDAGALLDLLVRKNIITDQEAEEVRGELTRETAQTPGGKLKISNPVTELEIYGDARVRYEIRNGQSGVPSTLVTISFSATATVTGCVLASAAR
jgi:hypothetical protein